MNAPDLQLPLRDGSIPLARLIDAYMAAWTGRDTTRTQRLAFWRGALGHVPFGEVNDDDIHAAREQLAQQRGRVYSGRDAEGKVILRAKRGKLSGPTLNRYTVALSAVFTWAIRQRIAPRNFANPVRAVPAFPENPGRVRFLSDEERKRLLAACRASKWERLWLLVMLAITTGARRSELIGLRWRDVDLERRVAYVARTKNGDPKVMPLVPAVLAELQRFAPGAKPDALVFPARLRADHPMAFEDRWRQALKAARVQRFRWHDLRHTCASYLAQHGASLLEVADVLGHKTVRMAARYSHLSAGHRAALVERVMGEIR
ncbi:MAG: site-specific integrase [Rubrivivax sp.]|nr:site-specific integrase [Rubrivivax sp.]